MKHSMNITWWWPLLVAGCWGMVARGEALPQSAASAPKGVSLSLYDTGLALVSELRTVTLAQGPNRVRFAELPAQLEPGSVSYEPLGGNVSVDVTEQSFRNDAADLPALLTRFLGHPVEVKTAQGTAAGIVVSAPGKATPLVLRDAAGAVTTFPALDQVESVRFPEARETVPLEPVLDAVLTASQEGPVNGRLTYTAQGFTWSMEYLLLLNEGGADASVQGRSLLRNRSGRDYEKAQVRLISTSRGQLPASFPAAADSGRFREPGLRYPYNGIEPVPEQAAVSASALRSLPVPEPVTLAAGEEKLIRLFKADKVPIRRSYVYDGVRFDRFQRNRRTDWSYGTEFHETVETRLALDNQEAAGLGLEWPAGRVRLLGRSADGVVELLAEARIPGIPAGESAELLLGPARGLRGERERTGYTEVVPLREAEESFEIRLANDSEDDVEILVIEHLYRGEQYELVKSDSEYTAAGPQVVHFKVPLKAGGHRAVHYTVRYRW